MCPLPREARKLLGVRDTDCLTPEAVCGHVHLILRLRHAMRLTVHVTWYRRREGGGGGGGGGPDPPPLRPPLL